MEEMFEKIGMFKRIPDTLLTRNIPHIPEIWSNLAKSNTISNLITKRKEQYTGMGCSFEFKE